MLGKLQFGDEENIIIQTRNPPHYFFGHLRETFWKREPVWNHPNPIMSEEGFRPWLDREGIILPAPPYQSMAPTVAPRNHSPKGSPKE